VSKRETNKERKRRDILSAGVRVFARDGFHPSRISDIASEANVGHGTVYLYFDSKETLLLAIYDELMGEAFTDARRAAEIGDGPVDKLRRFVNAQSALVEEHRELAELVLLETPHTSRFLSSNAVERMNDQIAFIESLLREGVRSGVFRPDLDALAVATGLFAAVQGVLTRWLLEKRTLSPRHPVECVLSAVLNGVLAQPSPVATATISARE
jgi:TetR/AcrR family fatty acid metabolism transcriptional regulator